MVIRVRSALSRRIKPPMASAVVGEPSTGRGRPCETCRHPNRLHIDLALLAGESLRSIAERAGLSHSSVARHKQNCVPNDLVQARISKKILDSDFLVAKVSKLLRSVEKVLDQAEETSKEAMVLAAARELRPTLELLAKFSTRSKPEAEPSAVQINAEITLLRTIILNALQPFPQARVAVATALSGASLPALRTLNNVEKKDS